MKIFHTGFLANNHSAQALLHLLSDPHHCQLPPLPILLYHLSSVHLQHLINNIATFHKIAMLCDPTAPLKSTSVQTTTMMHDANEI